MKKQLLLILSILVIGNNLLHAQVFKTKYSDFDEIRKRPLIVVTKVNNEKNIKKLKQKIAKAKKESKKKKLEKRLKNSLDFVKNYNANIKELTPKFLKSHPEIQFMNEKEYKDFYKKNKRKKQYSVLKNESYHKVYSGGSDNDIPFSEQSDTSIPALTYGRMEKSPYDYMFFIPYLGVDYGKITKADLTIAFKLMNKHIDYVVKNKKNRRYVFIEYAKDQAKMNCEQLAGKEIYIAKEMIHKKSSPDDIKSTYKYGKINIVSKKELEKIIENGQDKIVAILFPFTIIGKATSRVAFAKIILNAKDGTIYQVKGAKMGQYIDGKFRTKEFKKYGKCKK